jgi:hypothetical protein
MGTNVANGWSFPPLKECRQAWVEKYGPVDWDERDEWYALVSYRAKPVEAKPVAEPLDEVTDDEVRQYFKEMGAPDYMQKGPEGWGLSKSLKASIKEWALKRKAQPAAQVIPLVAKPLRRI